MLAEVDGTGETYQPDDLAEELHEPGVDPDLDLIAVRVDGVLAGYGQLRVAMAAGGRPGHRLARRRRASGLPRPGAGQAADGPAGGAGRDRGRRPASRHRGAAAGLRRCRGLARPGRCWNTAATRSSGTTTTWKGNCPASHCRADAGGQPVPHPSWARPPGWRTTTRSARTGAHRRGRSSSGRTWSARAPFGRRPASSASARTAACSAYVMVRQWAEGEAWIDLVGTRQQARGRGAGPGLPDAPACAPAPEQGYRTAALGVDSNNGQGAGALYSSLGFEVVRTFASYGRVIHAVVTRRRPGSGYSDLTFLNRRSGVDRWNAAWRWWSAPGRRRSRSHHWCRRCSVPGWSRW